MMITNAKGKRGFILHCVDRYVFRVYNKDHTFTDYDLHHCDLQVEITDDDAVFYLDAQGGGRLDHSPITLGLDDEKTAN